MRPGLEAVSTDDDEDVPPLPLTGQAALFAARLCSASLLFICAMRLCAAATMMCSPLLSMARAAMTLFELPAPLRAAEELHKAAVASTHSLSSIVVVVSRWDGKRERDVQSGDSVVVKGECEMARRVGNALPTEYFECTASGCDCRAVGCVLRCAASENW